MIEISLCGRSPERISVSLSPFPSSNRLKRVIDIVLLFINNDVDSSPFEKEAVRCKNSICNQIVFLQGFLLLNRV